MNEAKRVTTPKAPRCPICGSPAIPIVYGLPDVEAAEAADQGRIVLGGCVVTGSDPAWACTGRERHLWEPGDETGAQYRDSIDFA